jgi:hypothetical protein
MRHEGPLGGAVVVVVPALMVIPTFVLCVSAPLVPVTASVKVPVEAPEVRVTVRVDVAVPPEGGVTGPGRLMETPEGAVPTHEYVSVTAELNPLVEAMFTFDVPDPPAAIVSEPGLAPIVKSGVSVIVNVSV